MDTAVQFQIHNGSIKSFDHLRISNHVDSFQFHNGSIKRLSRQLNTSSHPPFQFHNGSIKSVQLFTMFTESAPVSIPQWFD